LNFGLKLLGQVSMQHGQAQLTDHTFTWVTDFLI
jgi:hypothetical protein